MSMDSEMYRSSDRNGFFFGPTVKLVVPVANLGLDISALYDERKAEVTGVDENNRVIDTEDVTRRSIIVPLNVRYGINLADVFEIFAKAGPQFGFNVGDTKAHILEDNLQWQSSEFSINIGCGIVLANQIEFAANYNVICGKTGEASFRQGWEYGTKSLKDWRNHAWQIAATYYF